MPFTASDLTAIDRAIASGELSVRDSDGKMVEFRDIDALLKARQAIVAEINSTSYPNRVVPRHMLASFRDE